jgi:plasmid stabilization system protein ParE
MYSVRFSRTAAVELVRVAEQSQPTFFQDLDNALQVLSELPYACPVIERNIRRLPMRRAPFNILYRIIENTVLIVRVIHDKRLH